MSTATDTELDERTRDELQPPCESSLRDGRSATHASVWQVTCDHIDTIHLLCAECADHTARFYAPSRRVYCTTCRATVKLLRIEPLR